jgi:hypothetical protein
MAELALPLRGGGIVTADCPVRMNGSSRFSTKLKSCPFQPTSTSATGRCTATKGSQPTHSRSKDGTQRKRSRIQPAVVRPRRKVSALAGWAPSVQAACGEKECRASYGHQSTGAYMHILGLVLQKCPRTPLVAGPKDGAAFRPGHDRVAAAAACSPPRGTACRRGYRQGLTPGRHLRPQRPPPQATLHAAGINGLRHCPHRCLCM